MQNTQRASAFNNRIVPVPSSSEPLKPLHGVDIQPSDACPRNFVVFDQSNTRSQIIFHPEIRSKFFDFGLADDSASILKGKDDRKDANYEGKFFSLLKEDSDDIDALLSMEDVENKEYDDDEVRTARTDATYECNFPGSCSNYESPPRKRSVLGTSVIHCNYKKGERMRTMVKVLRRMVPGAKQMSTVTVLDEAVRYLKSLEAQVHNLETGIQNL
ncbi:transcription factor bHLH144-like isoform X1 [Primulina huaijiensis]|uniref:transcription factor bHLH144-like isoform X1 n=1 Tax=Primulina huaijiensis TaxID=1492673 RepID=UPI003CC6EB29